MPRRRTRSNLRPTRAPQAPRVSPELAAAQRDVAHIIRDAFAPGRLYAAEALDPQKIIARLDAALAKHFAIPAPAPPDLSIVSDDAYEHVVFVEKPITPQRIRDLQHWAKEHWGWSRRHFCKAFDISRGMLSHLETGKRAVSEAVELRFRHWERRRHAWVKDRRALAQQRSVVVSDHPLPKRYHVLKPVVKCKTRGCGIWFEQVNKRHKKHAPDCKPKGPRRARKL